MTLGNAIKTLRTACKVKQQDLAGQMGVSANYISLVEGDKREPSIAFLKKLSKQLNVPVSMFFLWQETEGQNTNTARLSKIQELLLGIESSYLRQRISTSGRRKGRR
jgi:transcriptional regulator with XRE-family HTH domain